MNKVQVDEEQIRFAAGATDHMVVPDLLEQGAWLGHGFSKWGGGDSRRRSGVWATVSLDPLAIGGIALESLTRGYRTEECATYGIDPCPTTLAQVMQRYGGSA